MKMPAMITKFLGRTEKAPTAKELQEWAGIRSDARDISKGFIIAKEGSDPFGGYPLIMRFLYNPTQLTASKSINYAITEIPGSPNPLIEFLSGKETKWNFELQLHVPNQHDLDYVINVTDKERQYIEQYGFVNFQLQKFTALTSNKTRFQPPPMVELFFPGVTTRQIQQWDATKENPISAVKNESLVLLSQSTNGLKVQGVISDYKVQLLMFDRFMRPMSAKVEVTIIKAVSMGVKSKAVKKKSQSTQEKVAAPSQKINPTYFKATVEYLENKYNVNTWKDLTAAMNEVGNAGLHDVKTMNKQGIRDLGSGRVRDGVYAGKKCILNLPAKGKFANETGLRKWEPEAPNADNYDVNARTMTIVSSTGMDATRDNAYPHVSISSGPWEEVKLELPQ